MSANQTEPDEAVELVELDELSDHSLSRMNGLGKMGKGLLGTLMCPVLGFLGVDSKDAWDVVNAPFQDWMTLAQEKVAAANEERHWGKKLLHGMGGTFTGLLAGLGNGVGDLLAGALQAVAGGAHILKKVNDMDIAKEAKIAALKSGSVWGLVYNVADLFFGQGLTDGERVLKNLAKHVSDYKSLGPELQGKVAEKAFQVLKKLKVTGATAEAVEAAKDAVKDLKAGKTDKMRSLMREHGREMAEGVFGKETGKKLAQVAKTLERLEQSEVKKIMKELKDTPELAKIKAVLQNAPNMKHLSGSNLDKKLKSVLEDADGLANLKLDIKSKVGVVTNILKATKTLGVVGQANSFEDALYHLQKLNDLNIVEKLAGVKIKGVDGVTALLDPIELARLRQEATQLITASMSDSTAEVRRSAEESVQTTLKPRRPSS